MCIYSKLIINPKYLPNKKNKGNPPECTDKRTWWVPVSCGHCIECRKKRGREWQIRLSEEIKRNPNAKFITFTFNDETLRNVRKLLEKTLTEVTDHDIATYCIRHWQDNVRKFNGGIQPKHWLVTELTPENGRIHLHGIIWHITDELIRKWEKYGYVYIGKYVNEKTINYIIKYIFKIDPKHPHYVPKIYASPGIGKGYLYDDYEFQRHTYVKGDTNEMYKFRNGREAKLPNYYRLKMWTDEEREKIWIDQQEKGIIYVLGEAIKADDQELLDAKLQEARRLNERLYKESEEEYDAKKQRERLRAQRKYIKNHFN